MNETKFPAWCRISSKLARSDDGLAQMAQGYECDARTLYDDYRQLENLRKSGSCSGQKYTERKHSLDNYKTALLAVRKLVRTLIAAKSGEESAQHAREGYQLAVICESCGELKRRKYRSDALQCQREHRNEFPKHAIEIVERKAEPKTKKQKGTLKAQAA
jgi:hypothetical protein